MPGRLFVHIGPPKSGTSYLQKALWANREALERVGYELPLESARAQKSASAALMGSAASNPRGLTRWTELAQLIEQADHDTVVSQELLSYLPDDRIEHLVASVPTTEVHVVITARDPSRQLTSLWQQTVKQAGRPDFPDHPPPLAEYADLVVDRQVESWNVQQELPDLIKRWSAHVPPERISVVTVPDSSMPHETLWQRFAAALGADAGPVTLPDSGVNMSLDHPQTELLRQVVVDLAGSITWPDPGFKVIRLDLVKCISTRASEYKITLPERHAAWARSKSEEIVTSLHQAGVRIVGDEGDLRGTASPRVVPPENEMAFDPLVVAALSQTALRMAELHTKVARRDAKVNDLTARLEKRTAALRAARRRARNAPQRASDDVSPRLIGRWYRALFGPDRRVPH